MKLRLVLLLFVSVKCVHAGLVLSPPGSAPPGSPGDPTVDGGVGMGADINVVAGRAQGLGAGVADVGAGTGGVLDSGVGGGTMETGVAGGVIDTAGAPGGVMDAGAAGGTIDVGAGAVAGAEIGKPFRKVIAKSSIDCLLISILKILITHKINI